jgi:hypothetical protein
MIRDFFVDKGELIGS